MVPRGSRIAANNKKKVSNGTTVAAGKKKKKKPSVSSLSQKPAPSAAHDNGFGENGAASRIDRKKREKIDRVIKKHRDKASGHLHDSEVKKILLKAITALAKAMDDEDIPHNLDVYRRELNEDEGRSHAILLAFMRTSYIRIADPANSDDERRFSLTTVRHLNEQLHDIYKRKEAEEQRQRQQREAQVFAESVEEEKKLQDADAAQAIAENSDMDESEEEDGQVASKSPEVSRPRASSNSDTAIGGPPLYSAPPPSRNHASVAVQRRDVSPPSGPAGGRGIGRGMHATKPAWITEQERLPGATPRSGLSQPDQNNIGNSGPAGSKRKSTSEIDDRDKSRARTASSTGQSAPGGHKDNTGRGSGSDEIQGDQSHHRASNSVPMATNSLVVSQQNGSANATSSNSNADTHPKRSSAPKPRVRGWGKKAMGPPAGRPTTSWVNAAPSRPATFVGSSAANSRNADSSSSGSSANVAVNLTDHSSTRAASAPSGDSRDENTNTQKSSASISSRNDSGGNGGSAGSANAPTLPQAAGASKPASSGSARGRPLARGWNATRPSPARRSSTESQWRNSAPLGNIGRSPHGASDAIQEERRSRERESPLSQQRPVHGLGDRSTSAERNGDRRRASSRDRDNHIRRDNDRDRSTSRDRSERSSDSERSRGHDRRVLGQNNVDDRSRSYNESPRPDRGLRMEERSPSQYRNTIGNDPNSTHRNDPVQGHHNEMRETTASTEKEKTGSSFSSLASTNNGISQSKNAARERINRGIARPGDEELVKDTVVAPSNDPPRIFAQPSAGSHVRRTSDPTESSSPAAVAASHGASSEFREAPPLSEMDLPSMVKELEEVYLHYKMSRDSVRDRGTDDDDIRKTLQGFRDKDDKLKIVSVHAVQVEKQKESGTLNELEFVPADKFQEILKRSLYSAKLPADLKTVLAALASMQDGLRSSEYQKIPREKGKFTSFVSARFKNIPDQHRNGSKLWEWLVTENETEFSTHRVHPAAERSSSDPETKNASSSPVQVSPAHAATEAIRESTENPEWKENCMAMKPSPKTVKTHIGAEDNDNPLSGFDPKFLQHGRSSFWLTFTPTEKLKNSEFQEVCRRLKEWEPFWIMEWIADMRKTAPVSSQSAGETARRAVQLDMVMKDSRNPRAMTSYMRIPPSSWGECKPQVENGETRFLLMALPDPKLLKKKKRADGHLWPQGTFVQLIYDGKTRKPLRISQRKQQSHNAKEWKGLSKILDLTEYVKESFNHIKLDIICHDEDPFYFVAGFFRKHLDKEVHESLVAGSSKERIQHLSREEATKKALGFAKTKMLCLGDSDGDDDEEEEAGKMIFSLKDSTTKRLMEYPVRGKDCAHFQCFDLFPFVAGNIFMSGQRWRCPACEKFVSLQQLQHCGLTAALTTEFRDKAAAKHDRVEFRSDRSYCLLDERKRSYNKLNGRGKSTSVKQAPGQSSRGSKQSHPPPDDEIIIL